ncbi:MAG TPA: hypothetical protein VGE36_13595 [Roseateles sp.]
MVKTNSSASLRKSDATSAEQRIQSDATASTSQGTAFARSTGLPARMGKATEDCKTKLPFEVKSDLTKLLHALGMTESEWVRLQVMKGLYGADEVASMHLNHIRAAVGIGPLQGQNEAATS